jgi:hypothetical protein
MMSGWKRSAAGATSSSNTAIMAASPESTAKHKKLVSYIAAVPCQNPSTCMQGW